MGEVLPKCRKTLSLDDLRRRRDAARRDGRVVVQCHGCFDIVHPGHIRHLQHARSLGDVLLVSITGDAEMAKGTGRPLIPQELRAENLAALDCVDWVYIEQRPTARELLEDVRPDLYVKGREYETSADPRFRAERDAVERHGGRVVYSSGDVVFSSTALIAALQDTADPFHARLRELSRQHDLRPSAIEPMLASFRGRRVVVVGQAIIDTYVLCDRPEVAGESPILTLRPVEWRSYDGGAAIIARHLAAMGASPIIVTGLPRTPEAEALRQRLEHDGIEVRAVEAPDSLVEKQRFLVGAQKVMKLDLARPITLDSTTQKRLIDTAERASAECDGAIVVDFGQRLLSPGVVAALCEAMRPHVGVLAGDVSGRRSSLLQMRRMDLLCPNEAELRDALNDYDDGLSSVVWRMLERTGSRAALVKMGEDGLIAFDRVGEGPSTGNRWNSRIAGEHVPALAGHAIDPLGAGDALLAAATLALCADAPMTVAGVLGSIAAAAEVQRLGNVVIGAPDLRAGLQRFNDARLALASEAPPTRPAMRLVEATPA